MAHDSLSGFLRDQFGTRALANPRYSVRAFARDLGVSPSNLSKVMRGRRGFSRVTLKSLGGRLGLGTGEIETLHLLGARDFSRSVKIKKQAKSALEKSRLYPRNFDPAHFEVISHWYILPILVLIDLGVRNLNSIVSRLGVAKTVVESAITRLTAVGAIKERRGVLTSSGNFFANPAGLPSSSIRSLHRQVLEKALQSLECQSVDEREVFSLVIGFDPSKMPEVRKRIRQFRERMAVEFGGKGHPQEVYGLSAQFFRMSQPLLKEKSK